jgi:carboxymethylenebutenolidase
MGEFIQLTAADGHTLSAYRADPNNVSSGTPKGALVVVQEIFGVNGHIREVCDGFAADGYVAIAPALFDRIEKDVELGYEPDDIARGRELKGAANYDDALADVTAAVQAVADVGKVGIVGYCWGGSVTWLAACRVNGLSAAVPYYGGDIAAYASEKPKVPVMMHFGELDQSIPLSDVDKIRTAQPGAQIFVYTGAQHGFSCDHRGQYSADDTAEARRRTLDFFAAKLG